MHLAEINVARLKHPLDDPRVAEFADNIDRINGLAERAEGFVWRLTDDDGIFDDPNMITTISVWQDAEALERFVWNTVHKRFYNKRQQWFSAMDSHHFAMWWVEEGAMPTRGDARDRLEHLDRHGDTDFAFGWSHLPHIKLWQKARCA